MRDPMSDRLSRAITAYSGEFAAHGTLALAPELKAQILCALIQSDAIDALASSVRTLGPVDPVGNPPESKVGKDGWVFDVREAIGTCDVLGCSGPVVVSPSGTTCPRGHGGAPYTKWAEK